MNKYIIPVCNLEDYNVYNIVITATSYSDCQERLMAKFDDYSEDYEEFLDSMYDKGYLFGDITDIETL